VFSVFFEYGETQHRFDLGTVRLPAIVGLGRALDLILTGRAVPASEALTMGAMSFAQQLVLVLIPFPGPRSGQSSCTRRRGSHGGCSSGA
jgi:hypothetical protein